jgi:hypothetical protein
VFLLENDNNDFEFGSDGDGGGDEADSFFDYNAFVDRL